jgi:hypothetical protein
VSAVISYHARPGMLSLRQELRKFFRRRYPGETIAPLTSPSRFCPTAQYQAMIKILTFPFLFLLPP